MAVELLNITFAYEDSIHPVFEDLTLTFALGWTGVVGPNGAGKSTLLGLACGDLAPRQGRVVLSGLVVQCPQRTHQVPAGLQAFLEAQDRDANRLRGQLGLGADWTRRWSTLSHGERKRAQIGLALWQRPDVLAVDEPTNHIDSQARELLIRAMRQFQGVGILVSHDRELLDSLCSSCVFLGAHTVTVRPGGYSAGAQQASRELDSQWQERAAAVRRLRSLETELRDRKQRAENADRLNSKRGIPKGDSDAKARINLGRLTGKDAIAGRLSAQLESRVARSRREADALAVEVPKETGIWLPGTCSSKDSLFLLERGSIPLPGGGALVHQGLRMKPCDRIGITGPNGGGKSTLVRHILGQLMIPADKLLYLPQELGPEETEQALERLGALSHTQLGQVMTIVTRLGSAAPRLMETTAPSPGELRKLILALGILNSPYLVVMDEPTNHLDITAIECLQSALADCPAGLLLVSHDRPFLRHLTTRTWHVEAGAITEEAAAEPPPL